MTDLPEVSLRFQGPRWTLYTPPGHGRSEMTMSNIGLPGPCVEDHFDPSGLCQCPCEECTTRTAKICVCRDCRCESSEDHTTWVWRVPT